MIFTTGYQWLDLTYFIFVIISSLLYVFKPWKDKNPEEIKMGKKIVRHYTSKSGRRGYITKSQQDFEAKYLIFGALVSFFIFILPWILQVLNLISLK